MNWILCEYPGTPTVMWTANGKVQTHEEAQVFVHDLNLFVTVQLLDSNACCLIARASFAKTTDTLYEWVSCQKPRSTTHGKSIICKRDNFAPLVVQRLSTIPESSSSSASLSQDSLGKEAEQAPREPCATCFKFVFKFSIRAKWRTSIQEIGAIPKNPKPKWKEEVTGRIRKIRWQIFLTGYRISRKIWKKQNCMHPHTVLRNQIWNILRKWQRNQGSTVFTLTSQKTEIATYAWEPK